ncbi:MAG: hypothetical protein SFV22_12175 [Saprospiraceae bacterium]|nr:hypothetical protein [Saprospiraceae bacterium]
MNRFIFFFVVGILAVHCKHENTPVEKIYFTGLTMTDENGQSLGQTDPTDWGWADTWTIEEKNLFNHGDLPLCPAPPSDSIGVFFMPNPCKEAFFLSFMTPTGYDWRFKFVDEAFNVLKEVEFLQATPLFNGVHVQTTSFPKDTIRVYYQIEKNGCALRGHGDILIED